MSSFQDIGEKRDEKRSGKQLFAMNESESLLILVEFELVDWSERVVCSGG